MKLKTRVVAGSIKLLIHHRPLVYLQNALAATTAPFQGQYSGFETAYPYAATGESWLNDYFISKSLKVDENYSYYSAGNGGSTGYMTPYGTYATLPQQGAFNGLTNLPYQNAAANASLQEARLQ